MRPAGVAARSRAAAASSAAWAWASGVPASSRMRWATSRRSSIGVEVPPVTPTTRASPNAVASDRSCMLSIWIAGVPAISHSRVSSLVFALERPPTTTIRSTSFAASSVSSWRRIVTGQTVLTILSSWARDTMNAASRSNFQGGWVDWLMSAIRFLRGIGGVPLLFLVDDDRVGREAEHADDLGVLRACRAGRSCSPPRRAWSARDAPG